MPKLFGSPSKKRKRPERTNSKGPSQELNMFIEMTMVSENVTAMATSAMVKATPRLIFLLMDQTAPFGLVAALRGERQRKHDGAEQADDHQQRNEQAEQAHARFVLGGFHRPIHPFLNGGSSWQS